MGSSRELRLNGRTREALVEDAAKKGIRGRFVMLAWPPLRDSDARERLRALESDRAITYAVRFFPDGQQTTKAYDEYLERYFRFVDNAVEYDESQSVHGLSSTNRTCKSCSSHIAIEYLQGEACPVCGNDLRSNTVQKTLERWRERIAKVREQGEAEALKAGWLGSWAAISLEGGAGTSDPAAARHEALRRSYDSTQTRIGASADEEILYLPRQTAETIASRARSRGLSLSDYLDSLLEEA